MLLFAALDRARKQFEAELEKKKVENKKARHAPIYDEMRRYLEMVLALRDAKYPDCKYVIAEGKRVYSIKTSWNAAIRRLGLPQVLIHDLRRTAVSNMDEAGVPRADIMEMAGWTTKSMFRCGTESGQQSESPPLQSLS